MAGGKKLHLCISKKDQKMRINPGSIRCDLAVIADFLKFKVAAATISEFSIEGVFASTCRNLLIPSTFVSGQRTR
jgi:hypothetical protein